MCGIVGYVGKRRVVPVLLEGLKKLEYRGYDSAGIVYLKDGELIDAISESDRGEAVAVATLAWDKPNYSIEFEIPADCRRTIKTPMLQLLRIACDCFENTPL